MEPVDRKGGSQMRTSVLQNKSGQGTKKILSSIRKNELILQNILVTDQKFWLQRRNFIKIPNCDNQISTSGKWPHGQGRGDGSARHGQVWTGDGGVENNWKCADIHYYGWLLYLNIVMPRISPGGTCLAIRVCIFYTKYHFQRYMRAL